MLQRTVPAVVDTRIWDGTRDPKLIKWLGEDTHRFDGHQLVLQTSDGDVYPEPGWTLLRWPDGDLTVMSSRVAAKRLAPTTAAPIRETAELQARITQALTTEWYRRAEERIEASPEAHNAAMAEVVMRVLAGPTRTEA